MYCIYNGELTHHGILGMKWGVRRYQNKDGTLTELGKKRFNNLPRKSAPIKSKNNILTGDEAVLKRGTELLRVTSQEESVDDRIKYATLKDETGDYGNYTDTYMWSYNRGDKEKLPLLETYELKKDLKVATGERVLNDLLDKYGDEPASNYGVASYVTSKKKTHDIIRSDLGRMKMRDLFAEMGDFNDIYRSGKSYYDYDKDGRDDVDEMLLTRAIQGHDAIDRFLHRHFDRKAEVLEKHRKAGYDAVADVMDIGQGFARQPVIILDPKKTVKKTSTKTIRRYDDFRHPKGDYGYGH